MKKYLTGVLAIIIGVGLSAFTAPTSTKKIVDNDNYYWYEIVSDRTVGEPVSSSPMDIDAAENLVSGCDERDGTICLAGFAGDNVSVDTPAPSPTIAEDNLLFVP